MPQVVHIKKGLMHKRLNPLLCPRFVHIKRVNAQTALGMKWELS